MIPRSFRHVASGRRGENVFGKSRGMITSYANTKTLLQPRDMQNLRQTSRRPALAGHPGGRQKRGLLVTPMLPPRNEINRVPQWTKKDRELSALRGAQDPHCFLRAMLSLPLAMSLFATRAATSKRNTALPYFCGSFPNRRFLPVVLK